MNVYIFMGTHMPEMETAVSLLTESIPEGTTATIYHPQSIPWKAPVSETVAIQSYDPETFQWVFDVDAAGNAFIILDPHISPVEQLEALAEDLGKCLIEPVKVVTCVDCERAESVPQLRVWLEACIYYSDATLLGNRQNASKTFIREFQKGYEKQCYPCLFLFLKGEGKPDKPLEILTPDTRRLSQLFDLPQESDNEIPGLIIESSCDLDVDEPESDPFRAPDPESGQAAAIIPDIREWIVPTSK